MKFVKSLLFQLEFMTSIISQCLFMIQMNMYFIVKYIND